MKNQIANLVKLQEFENESHGISKTLNDVSIRFDALDTALKELEQTVENEESKISELKKKYREQESDVQMNLSQIKKSQAKLGVIKDNREYQAVLKEIEKLKAMNSRIEDEMLEGLEFTESSEKEVSAKKEELTKLSERVESEKEEIRKEAERGKKKLAELKIECQEYYYDNISGAFRNNNTEKLPCNFWYQRLPAYDNGRQTDFPTENLGLRDFGSF